MKAFKSIMVFTLSAIIFVSAGASAQDKKTENNKVEVTFSIPDIDCMNCQKKIEAKLPYEKGVKDMKIDLASKTIWVSFEADKTTKDNLAKALDKLGYPAKEIEKK